MPDRITWTGENIGMFTCSGEALAATEVKYGGLEMHDLLQILREVDPDVNWSDVTTRTAALIVLGDCWGPYLVGDFK
nr:hypothetical protein [Rhodococcus sp. (in: high G+C Gram-positive bacteria)]